MTKRHFAVFTSSRADFGIFLPLLKWLKSSEACLLTLIVSGTHLSLEHGQTINEIEQYGFQRIETIDILTSSTCEIGNIRAASLALKGCGEILHKLQPDILVVLGDRFETLPCVQASVMLNIPVAHLHGGETTGGSLDDLYRNAISKLSQLHFVSHSSHAKKLLKIGEPQSRIFDFGSLSAERISSLEFRDLRQLEIELDFSLSCGFLMVSLHSATAEKVNCKKMAELIVDAVSKFDQFKVVISGPNADEGGQQIRHVFKEWSEKHPNRILYRESYGWELNVNLMRNAKSLIGNSSSGIIEAASVGLPVINIGNRQKSRFRGANVIDARFDLESIEASLHSAMSARFVKIARRQTNPFFKFDTAKNISEVLLTTDLSVIKPTSETV